VLNIVRGAYSPDAVTKAVEELLSEPSWARRQLYEAVLDALDALEDRLQDQPRTIDMIAGEVSREEALRKVQRRDVERAIADLAGASQGALVLRDERLILDTSVDELRRRVSGLSGNPGTARRKSTFRDV
jgi:hypothetical protein